MNFVDQLFNGLAALSLKQAAALRPLTESEKDLLKQSESKAGGMLPQMEEYVKEIKGESRTTI